MQNLKTKHQPNLYKYRISFSGEFHLFVCVWGGGGGGSGHRLLPTTYYSTCQYCLVQRTHYVVGASCANVVNTMSGTAVLYVYSKL